MGFVISSTYTYHTPSGYIFRLRIPKDLQLIVGKTEFRYPITIRFSQVSAFSKEAINAWAQQHLTPKRNVVTDGLECFAGFKESGHELIVFVTSSGPQIAEMPEFKWVNTIIGYVKNALHGTFHAISKKHFPCYLAEFYYRFNRRYDLKQMIALFGYIAVRTTPTP